MLRMKSGVMLDQKDAGRFMPKGALACKRHFLLNIMLHIGLCRNCCEHHSSRAADLMLCSQINGSTGCFC